MLSPVGLSNRKPPLLSVSESGGSMSRKSYFNSWRHPSHQVVFSTEIPCSQHNIEQELWGAKRIAYFSSCRDVSDKQKAFLDYIASGKPSDGFTNELENEVKKARDHIKWRTEYMTFLEQLERERIEARAEGLAEGRAEGLKEGRAEGLEQGRAEGLEQGRTEERANTELEKARADAAEKRADALAEEILELKRQLESLK